jgi:hypothetical protein
MTYDILLRLISVHDDTNLLLTQSIKKATLTGQPSFCLLEILSLAVA